MKKYFSLMISLVAISAVSCDRIDEISSSPIVEREFTAILGGNTRTSADAEGNVDWEAGDVIKYYTAKNGEVKSATVPTSGNSATIRVQMEENASFFVAEYGGTGITDNTSGNTFTINGAVNATQTGLFKDAHVAVAKTYLDDGTEYRSLNFKNITAIIKFTLERSDVAKIIFTAANGEKIHGNGTVKINFSGTDATPSFGDDGGSSITVNTNGAGTYYIATLPVNLSNGFTISCFDSSETLLGTVTGSKSMNVKKNDIVNLGALDSHIIQAPSTSISINRTSADLLIAESLFLKATTSPIENAPVTWNSSDPSVAAVDETGKVTAISVGEATISASSGGKVSNCQIHTIKGTYYQRIYNSNSLTSGHYLIVYEDGGVAFNGGLETLDVVENTISVNKGSMQQSAYLDSAAFYYDLSDGSIKSSSGYYIGQPTDANGLKTSKTSDFVNSIYLGNNANIVSNCGAIIRFNDNTGQKRFRFYKSSSYSGGLLKEIQLYKLFFDSVTSISLNKSSATLDVGESIALVATVSPPNTSIIISWSSSNSDVASVDDNGTITAISPGTAIITALAGGKQAECSISVNQIAVESITLDNTNITLAEGESLALTATISPSNASNKTVTWSSSDISIATVSNDGLVTAIREGNATITATAGGISSSCIITVIPLVRVAVDLGLSVKWSSCNLGASRPEGLGDHYAWGETETKTDYSWSTYKWTEGTSSSYIKYCNDPQFGYHGYTDPHTILESSDDVAQVKLGDNWHIPTHSQWAELKSNCTWRRDNINGVEGYRVTGENGNSIFLPFAGIWKGSSIEYSDAGYYWSSSLSYIYCDAYYMTLFTNTKYIDHRGTRCYGLSIRPVK